MNTLKLKKDFPNLIDSIDNKILLSDFYALIKIRISGKEGKQGLTKKELYKEKIVVKQSLADIDTKVWDNLASSYYQTSAFLRHAEKYNPREPRYYLFYQEEILEAAAIVYTIPVNLLTFSNRSLNVKMNIIGVPVSVDASGLLGNSTLFEALVKHIIEAEKGIVLALNYSFPFENKDLIQMRALPTLLFEQKYKTFEHYKDSMRHPYRRRIKNAAKKFQTVNTSRESCAHYTEEHHKLYLNIMNRTNSKLEILTSDFFKNLPLEFILTSYYTQDNQIITWHITCFYQGVYYFLFGGINYELRDQYNGYYNNLLGIIEEGIDKGSNVINLGQTAEIPKMRVGASLGEKRMFIYHKNSILRGILKLAKKQLEYGVKFETLNVFKSEKIIEDTNSH